MDDAKYHLRSYGDVSKAELDYYAVHRTLEGFPRERDDDEVLCACKDRPLAQCPGEWEPGCDLGANEKFVSVGTSDPAKARTPELREALHKIVVDWLPNAEGEYALVDNLIAALEAQGAPEPAYAGSIHDGKLTVYADGKDVWSCELPGATPQAAIGAEPPALTRYKQSVVEGEEPDPVERLRFFCSLAMTGQDWLDVEPFFDAVAVLKPSADGVVSAAADLLDEYERGAAMPLQNREGFRAAIARLRALTPAHSKSEFKRRTALGDKNVLPPT